MSQLEKPDDELEGDQQNDDDLQKLAARRLGLVGEEAIHLVNGRDLRIDLPLPIGKTEAARSTAVESRVVRVADNLQGVRAAIGQFGDVDDQVAQAVGRVGRLGSRA